MFQPVNFQRLDPATIDVAVDHALFVIQLQGRAMTLAGIKPSGASVLEFGPGSDFGPALFLASQGARVTVADRFLSGWQDDYHPAFYRKLADKCGGATEQLLAAASGGYDATTLTLVAEAAEALSSVPSASVDFIYSGAVLEHAADVGAVAHELARITKPGGCGFHIIDLRYHRDFSRPLDHLLMPEVTFALAAEDAHYEFGNRFRGSEFAAYFEAAGFVTRLHENTETASPAYLAELVPRLRTAPTGYRYWPESDLAPVCTQFLFAKGDLNPSNAGQERARQTLGLMSALKEAALAVRDAPTPSDDIELTSKMVVADGPAWVATGEAIPAGDDLARPYASRAQLLEDDRELGPPHSLHDNIRSKGKGRFSHWGNALYFSTSDGTSPLENGRRYVLRIPR